eukprot:XP_017446031.1 PREDICTED: protein LEG1 homolog [Rattus norvegicus]
METVNFCWFSSVNRDFSDDSLTASQLLKPLDAGRFSDSSNMSVSAYNSQPPKLLSSGSGWFDINFFVLAMNAFASVDTGVLENLGHQIALVSPGKKIPDFCYSLEECNFTYPQALEAAKTLYKYLQSRKPVSTLVDIPVYGTDEATATLLMWKAHRAAVNVGLWKFSDR